MKPTCLVFLLLISYRSEEHRWQSLYAGAKMLKTERETIVCLLRTVHKVTRDVWYVNFGI